MATGRPPGSWPRISGSGARNGAGQIDTKAVRKWASSNGIELSGRGRVPAEVIEKYKAAGH